MGIGLRGVKPLRLLESRDRICVLVLTSIDAAEVKICQANIGLQLYRLQQTGRGLVIIIISISYVTQIGKGLRIFGIVVYLSFEFGGSLLVLMLFPVEIAQAEMDIWLRRVGCCGGGKFCDGFVFLF